jgi:hypothetical protein
VTSELASREMPRHQALSEYLIVFEFCDVIGAHRVGEVVVAVDVAVEADDADPEISSRTR